LLLKFRSVDVCFQSFSHSACQVPLPTKELISYNTYAPSKFALRALSEVLRNELTWAKNEKIRVSSLSPGEAAAAAAAKAKQ